MIDLEMYQWTMKKKITGIIEEPKNNLNYSHNKSIRISNNVEENSDEWSDGAANRLLAYPSNTGVTLVL